MKDLGALIPRCSVPKYPQGWSKGDGFSCWLEPGTAESHNIQQELLQVMDETGAADEQEARPALEQHPQSSWQWRGSLSWSNPSPFLHPKESRRLHVVAATAPHQGSWLCLL